MIICEKNKTTFLFNSFYLVRFISFAITTSGVVTCFGCEKSPPTSSIVQIIFELCHEKINILVSDQVRHKPSCTATEDGWMLQISELEGRGIVLCTCSEIKALISFAVTAKLIFVFVFTYVKCWFSHDAAHFHFEISEDQKFIIGIYSFSKRILNIWTQNRFIPVLSRLSC